MRAVVSSRENMSATTKNRVQCWLACRGILLCHIHSQSEIKFSQAWWSNNGVLHGVISLQLVCGGIPCENSHTHTLPDFNFSICTRRTRFDESDSIVVPFHQVLVSWEQIFFSFGSNVSPAIPFILYSWCIVIFIDNLRTRNDKYANLVRYASQQRR